MRNTWVCVRRGWVNALWGCGAWPVVCDTVNDWGHDCERCGAVAPISRKTTIMLTAYCIHCGVNIHPSRETGEWLPYHGEDDAEAEHPKLPHTPDPSTIYPKTGGEDR